MKCKPILIMISIIVVLFVVSIFLVVDRFTAQTHLTIVKVELDATISKYAYKYKVKNTIWKCGPEQSYILRQMF